MGKVKVRFLELSRSPALARKQARIQAALERMEIEAKVCLFQDQDGKVGYSVPHVPADGGRRVLDAIHRAVAAELGTRRGRPAGPEPTRQVKCRIPESVYQRLARSARSRRLSPATYLRQMVEEQLEKSA